MGLLIILYLIKDEKTALIDTVKEYLLRPSLFQGLETQVEAIKDIDYIIVMVIH